MDIDYEIRPALADEWEEAMALAWRTFKKFVAPDYSELGISEFYDFISDNGIKKMFGIGEYKVWVAVKDNEIVGIVSVRTKRHISLLFVDGRYQKCGIGRNLLCTAAKEMIKNGEKFATVNASPFGVEFYHRVGFRDTGEERVESGMRITPMVWNFEELGPNVTDN